MSMCKSICLVQPNRAYLVHPSAQAPLGLLYVAGALLADGYAVSVLDLSECSNIPMVDEEVVGITGTYLDIAEVERLAAFYTSCKKRVVVGGPVSLSKELDRKNISLLVFGDGEGITHQIMDKYLTGVITGTPVYSIDTIPFPARHLWKGRLGGNIFSKNPCEESSTVMFSRGCCFRCAFCCSSSLNAKMRFRNPIKVADELESIVTTRGVSCFRFSDEYFNADPYKVSTLCSEIRSRKSLRNIRWRVSVAATHNDRSMFEEMRASGCEEISLGVESFDDRVLEGLGCAKCSPERVIQTAKNAKSSGITVRALLMCGVPYETDLTVQLNQRLIGSQYIDTVAMTILTPLPGSELYENPEKFGCTLRNGKDTGMYLYGPHGQHKFEPKILRNDMTFEEHCAIVAKQVDNVEHSGKVGKG